MTAKESKEKSAVNLFGEVLIPMFTPFDDYAIDHEKTGDLVDYLVKKNYCDSLIIAGTNGEFYALSEDERKALFKTAQMAADDRIPIIAGTGANTTRQTIEYSKVAEDLDYDGVMILPPYYGKPTQEEVLQHFEDIAREIDLPIIIYNIPIFTGVNIVPQTTEKLARIDNVIAIKEEAGINPVQCSEVALNTPADFTVYSGDDVMVLQILVQGGSGVVSGGSHVVGDLMKKQIDYFNDGKPEKAKNLYLKTYKLFDALSQGDRINPIPLTKAALNLTGFEVGEPRPPLQPATEEEKERLEEVLVDLGKI